ACVRGARLARIRPAAGAWLARARPATGARLAHISPRPRRAGRRAGPERDAADGLEAVVQVDRNVRRDRLGAEVLNLAIRAEQLGILVVALHAQRGDREVVARLA